MTLRNAALALLVGVCALLAARGAGAADRSGVPGPGGGSFVETEAAPAPSAEAPARADAATLLAAWPLEDPLVLSRISGVGRKHGTRVPLSSARARVMLQSLTLPGWGQLTEGRRGAARVFSVIDAGIWTSFVAFQVQQHLRSESALRTAEISAGIDLRGRSEEYRRIVGSFPTSDDYNVLVVFRDAANLFYDDPVAYRAYIAAHEVQGSGAWTWADPLSYQRYRDQRKGAQRAGLRANTALALALANRLISAVHAAGSSGGLSAPGHGVGLRIEPDFSRGPTAVRLELQTRF